MKLHVFALSLLLTPAALAQQEASIAVSATIGAAIPRCALTVPDGGMSFGTVSLPGDSRTGTATIAITGATPTISYVDDQSTTLPTPGSWSAGTLTLTAYNSNGITVATTFPGTLVPNPQLNPPATLTFAGTWAVATASTGPFTQQTGNYTATISGAAVQRFFRFGGTLTVPNSTPESDFGGTIQITATCASS